MVNIRIDGTDAIRAHDRMVNALLLGARQAAAGIGNIVVPKTKQRLKDKILRPRESHGRIEANITAEMEDRGGNIVVGVGNIEQMDSNVPWWRIQEQGGPVSRKIVPGFFVDTSGQIVPFLQSRNTKPPDWSTKSDDLFIWTPKGHPLRGGWLSPDQFGGGFRPTFMYIKRDIQGKWYFRDGFADSKLEVLALFKEGFKGAFRG